MREVEYGINIVSGAGGAGWNPFDENFGSAEEALEALAELWAESHEEAKEERAALIRWEFEGEATLRDDVLEVFEASDPEMGERIEKARSRLEKAVLEERVRPPAPARKRRL